QPSSTDMSMKVEETIPKVSMEADESMEVDDDVVNFEDQPQDDDAPKNDNSSWFKQDARPEILRMFNQSIVIKRRVENV
ncbi:hypothetical protein Tco_0584800, partial [Tanacetum coccineum]